MDPAPDFNRIVSEYEGRIVRYLATLLEDPVLARDLAQETFLKVHRGLDQLRNPEARTAWIYRIASNLAFDHLRSRTSRQEGQSLSLEGEFLHGDGVEPTVASEELSAEGLIEQEVMAVCLGH